MWIISKGYHLQFPFEQKSTSHNPRSTVGIITEIYDYLRLLYACVGSRVAQNINNTPFARTQSISQMVDKVLEATRKQ